jgi:hypothetical protein
MPLISKTYRRFHAAFPVAALMLASVAPAPARADFFDDVRRTFQTDIPHFFQDDIPCAFGGQPTSHTKASCRGSDRPAKHATHKNAIAPASAPARPPEVTRVPPEYP